MLDIASGKRKASETFRHIQKTSLILLFYIDDKKIIGGLSVIVSDRGMLEIEK